MTSRRFGLVGDILQDFDTSFTIASGSGCYTRNCLREYVSAHDSQKRTSQA